MKIFLHAKNQPPVASFRPDWPITYQTPPRQLLHTLMTPYRHLSKYRPVGPFGKVKLDCDIRKQSQLLPHPVQASSVEFQVRLVFEIKKTISSGLCSLRFESCQERQGG